MTIGGAGERSAFVNASAFVKTTADTMADLVGGLWGGFDFARVLEEIWVCFVGGVVVRECC